MVFSKHNYYFKYDLMMGLDEQLKDQCVGFSGI